ncbi:MAG TPA: DUF6056 family protein [Ignavibacteria bacterium]|nr:DUF6056 family protein [Ignavibacteria bacterium]HMR40022.1 DUF6056 family protein [Ignavibacteria bacterium]
MDLKVKKLTAVLFENSILLFLIFAIIPFILLTYFIHPSWDDFEYTGIATQNGFFQSQYIWYVTWSGRYFSQAFLSSVNPLIYGCFAGYKILSFVMLIAFILAVYITVDKIASGCLTLKQKLICTLSFCYLFVYGLPEAGLALYWMASSVIYQLANILMVFLAYFYIGFLRGESAKKRNVIIISLLIFAIIGCNEVSMLMTVVFFTGSFFYNSVVTKSINRNLLIFALVAVVSFIIVYMAPGNSYRLSTNPDSHQLLFSLKNSITDLIKFIIYRLYDLPLIIFTVLFISFYLKFVLNKKPWTNTVIINPFYSVGIYLISMFSGIFVSYWSLGTSTPYRTLNVIYFIFLAGWFVNIIIILNYINIKKQLPEKPIPEYVIVFLTLAILISFMKETNSVKTAYKDLKNGTAVKFNSELNERYDRIRSSAEDTVTIDSLTVIPDSFSYFDIGGDPDNKYNKLQAEFFNKKAIIRK